MLKKFEGPSVRKVKGPGGQVPHLGDEGEVSSQINLAARLLQKAARVRLGEVGAWPGQIPILLWLQEEELIQKDLIARTGMEQSTVAEHLDRLERAGLITRERAATDGRAYVIHLTEKGRSISADLIEGIRSGVPIFTKGTTPEQMIVFDVVIKKIIKNLNAFIRKAKAKG